MGKTTLSLAIAAAVTKGDMLPIASESADRHCDGGSERYVCRRSRTASNHPSPANVIVQNGEDSINCTIKPRLERLGADCEKIFTINDDDVALTYTDGRIEQSIIDTKAKWLIIDPVQAFWGRANMNAANGVRPVLKQLGAVAQRTGCAIIMVGHLRKSAGKSTYRGLGSIDIFAAVRSVLTVGRVDADSNIRVVVHNKSNLAPAGAAQTFGIDPVAGFYWAGESDASVDDVLGGNQSSKPDNKFAEAQSFIKTVLQNGAVQSAHILRMAHERGIAEKTLQRAKTELGVYSRKIYGAWYWELPIESGCSDFAVSEDGQDAHHGQSMGLTALPTVLPSSDKTAACPPGAKPLTRETEVV
jgi:hypothetical protein